MIQTNLTEEQKAEWIKALKSGKYKQCQNGNMTQYQGSSDVEYCCLAVLNCIAGNRVDDYKMPEQLLNNQSTHLVRTLYEMNDGSPNDPFPKSFSEIADYIEENLATKGEN